VKRALAVAVLVPALLAPGVAEAKLRFRDCQGIPCTRLAVPLDRSGAMPGRVSLYIERRRAARRPRRGVTMLLAGGPGQPATLAYAALFPEDSYADFGALTPRNDVVAFDNRGSGRSGLLRCPELERASLIDAGHEAAQCARRLGPRRGFYRTSDTVEDIEAVRAALGARKLTLIGVSYGTFVAQAYAARYPDRVERVLIDSVLDVSGWDPFYREIFGSVPRVLRAVCRSGCRRFTRDPVADVARLVERLARAPLRGRVTLPDGRRRRTALTRPELFFTLTAGDVDDVSRAAFPGAVKAALRGDPAPLLRLKHRAIRLEGSGSARDFSSALYAATACEEIPFPWTRFSEPASRFAQIWEAASLIPPAELYPFDTATTAGNDFIRMCRRWPEASPLPVYGPPPGGLPDIPVLMLAGELDLRTSVEAARDALADWPSARLLVAPNTGHSVMSADLSGCTLRAARRFFRGGRVPDRCRRRPTFFPASPPPPASLRELRPLRGVPGARGRMLSALELTLFDVAEALLAELFATDSSIVRGGGLRGGTWSWDLGSLRPLRLDGVELVPGVRVSGAIHRFAERRQHGRLRLSGPAGPDGVIKLKGERLEGRLGGRRIETRIAIGVLESARASGAGADRSLEELLRAGIRLAVRERMR
jgi:pimeloyl-ACP methyl ester carboxylesterase